MTRFFIDKVISISRSRFRNYSPMMKRNVYHYLKIVLSLTNEVYFGFFSWIKFIISQGTVLFLKKCFVLTIQLNIDYIFFKFLLVYIYISYICVSNLWKFHPFLNSYRSMWQTINSTKSDKNICFNITNKVNPVMKTILSTTRKMFRTEFLHI